MKRITANLMIPILLIGFIGCAAPAPSSLLSVEATLENTASQPESSNPPQEEEAWWQQEFSPWALHQNIRYCFLFETPDTISVPVLGVFSPINSKIDYSLLLDPAGEVADLGRQLETPAFLQMLKTDGTLLTAVFYEKGVLLTKQLGQQAQSVMLGIPEEDYNPLLDKLKSHLQDTPEKHPAPLTLLWGSVMLVVTSADGTNQFMYTPEMNQHYEWDRILDVFASVEGDIVSAKTTPSSPLPDAATVQIALADGSDITVQCNADSMVIKTGDGNTVQYQLAEKSKPFFKRLGYLSEGQTGLPYYVPQP